MQERSLTQTTAAHTLTRIYERRFADTAAHRKAVWSVLTPFFAEWTRPDDVVLDLGCGYGEFINNVRARRRLAMDLNPAVAERLDADVELLLQDCSDAWQLPDASLDVVFTSNFLEHLPDKGSIQRTVRQAVRCLRPGGRLVAMGPNIRFVGGAYWDFFDHHVALTDASLRELLEIEGFVVERTEPRFLPYTLVNSRPYPRWVLAWYLKCPCLWRIWGRQFLIVARIRGHVRATLA